MWKKKPDRSKYSALVSRESEHWSKLSELNRQRISWLHSPTVQRYVAWRVTGSDGLDWFSWIRGKYLQDRIFGPGMCLGCNDGAFDRDIMRAKLCSEFDGYDISEEALERARKEAEREDLPIRYQQADLNHVEFPEKHYALVVTVMTLHHIERLEALFGQVSRSLRPEGIFAINEYVGPTRFQIPDEHIGLINRLLALLPKRLRKRVSDGEVVERIARVRERDLVAVSPFEAIRSAEIVPLLEQYFNIVERRDYGGTILHWLLNYITPNFREEDSEEDRCILSLLCKIEYLLTQAGGLPSEFTVIVARKK